ncbi:MAG: hypothetical protein WC055_01795 [Melioribacteraceae bacterium]
MKISLIKNIALIIAFFLFSVSCSKKEVNPLSGPEYFLNYHFDEVNSDSLFSFKEANSKDFLLLLNKGYDKLQIIKLLKISSIQYDDLINSLFGDGLIKKIDTKIFIPSFPIIDSNEIKEIRKLSEPIGEDIALIIIDRLKILEGEMAKFPSYSPINYNLRSFLFSEVLLNRWQIKNIKENFIKSRAPEREGRHLYISLIEGDSSICKNPFELFINKDLIQDGNVYHNIADVIKNDLSNYLNIKRGLFLESYLKSNLKKTTSFKEYNFWIYQFIVKGAIQSLIKHGIIIPPKA